MCVRKFSHDLSSGSAGSGLLCLYTRILPGGGLARNYLDSAQAAASADFGNSLGLMVALLWRAISTRMPQLNNLTRLGASCFWLELAAKKAFPAKGAED